MPRIPLFIDLSDARCLVFGGTRSARVKAARLLSGGARVELFSAEPDIEQTLGESSGRFLQHQREYRAGDATEATLIVAATHSQAVNALIATEARTAHIPVNVAGHPELGTYLFPTLLERTPITVAIGSDGRAPALARLLKARLDAFLPASLGEIARVSEHYRALVAQRIPEPRSRRRFWESLLSGAVADAWWSGHHRSAEQQLIARLDQWNASASARGEVYLVGAGPGDPDLLTFRALRLMQQADVVLFDRLVADPILAMTRADAERIYVGKQRDQHTVRQPAINELLIQHALAGKRVLRLKGGDPFIFGRGGEEIETLAEHDIPFQIVPGITAASGCASYAGIPLTHRDHAQSCVFVTGHDRHGEPNLNWAALAQPHQTIVCYMGLIGLPHLSRELIRHGLAATTPAALIERGTTPEQRVLTGTLQSLPDVVAAQTVRAPTLIIIGGVVSLRERLTWRD